MEKKKIVKKIVEKKIVEKGDDKENQSPKIYENGGI